MDREELYIRSLETLQGEHRRQLSYIINLFIALSSGALAFTINLLTNDNFDKVISCVFLYWAAILSITLSFVAGARAIYRYLDGIKFSLAGMELIKASNENSQVIETVQAEGKKLHAKLKYWHRHQIVLFVLGGVLFLLAIVPYEPIYESIYSFLFLN